MVDNIGRIVTVHRAERKAGRFEVLPDKKGRFHGFGVDTSNQNPSFTPMTTTVGIIEDLQDGGVSLVPLHMFKFDPEPDSKWTAVDDHNMPYAEKPLLLFTDLGEMMQGVRTMGGWRVHNGTFDFEVGDVCKITHWMYRPEPPAPVKLRCHHPCVKPRPGIPDPVASNKFICEDCGAHVHDVAGRFHIDLSGDLYHGSDT